METGDYPGCWAQDSARRCGRGLLRARKAHLEGAGGALAAGSTVAVVALGLVLLCPQLLCFHWHRRLSWADLIMGSVRSRLKLWRLFILPAGLLTPSGQAISQHIFNGRKGAL